MASYTWPCVSGALKNSDLSSVRVYSSVHCPSHFLQVARITRPCRHGIFWVQKHIYINVEKGKEGGGGEVKEFSIKNASFFFRGPLAPNPFLS